LSWFQNTTKATATATATAIRLKRGEHGGGVLSRLAGADLVVAGYLLRCSERANHVNDGFETPTQRDAGIAATPASF